MLTNVLNVENLTEPEKRESLLKLRYWTNEAADLYLKDVYCPSTTEERINARSQNKLWEMLRATFKTPILKRSGLLTLADEIDENKRKRDPKSSRRTQRRFLGLFE